MTNPVTRTAIPPGPDPSTPDESHFLKAVTLYRELRFPPERIVVQLLNAGHSKARIREHFPDVPDSVYPEPRRTRTQQQQLTRAALVRHEGQGAGQLLPTAGELLGAVSGSLNTPGGVTARDTHRIAPTAGDLLSGLRHSNNSPPHAQPPGPKSAQHSSARDASASALSTSDSLSRVVSVSETSADISFQYVPLIQCSFPHADPGEVTTFSRRNGWLELTLSTARAGTGLPYGVPARLLTIYCASEAIRTRSPKIYLGSSVHEFLRELDVPITRGERGSLRVYANQLLRLIHCAISIDENIQDAKGRTGLHIRQALFAEEARLWWDEASGVGRGSSLVLSSVLFQSILERSAPLSTRAIKQLRKSPMDLDVYAWLVHRLFSLNRASTITWPQLSSQFGHSYAEPRKFRHFFLDSLKRVQSVYPEAKLKVGEAGLILLPSHPHIARDKLTATR